MNTNPLKDFIKTFDFQKPNWDNLPKDFPYCPIDNLTSEEVGKLNSIKTLWEFNRNVNENKRPSRKLPFRIPIIEKTTRQAQSLQGYKASAAWQTASLLRDLIQLLLTNITHTQYRRKNQLEDAARSMVSTFEEGWGRPSTKEFLDYMGFAQGSLAEVRGDVERLLTDGYLKSSRDLPYPHVKIPTPSREFPYPPVNSRKDPSKYGKLQERLREFTGKEITAKDLSYELLIEFVNKTDFLFKKTVEGLQNKVIDSEKRKLVQ